MTFYGKATEEPKTETCDFHVTLENGSADVRAEWVGYGPTHITFHSTRPDGEPKLEWAIRADLVREITEAAA